VAFLVVRARRAEKEKEELAQQLGEAREDVRRLSGEVEEMMATLQGGREEGEGLRVQAEAMLTYQLERVHATIELLEVQVGEARREGEERERELVGALEDVETLEEHLMAQNEAVRQWEETSRVQEEELGRVKAEGEVREDRVVSLSRRIGLLEKERMESQTRYFEGLRGGREGGREGEEGEEEGRGPSTVSPLLLAEVGRLQQALEESEEDRLTLEQQLVDVLREREELFGLCGLLRSELIAAATPAGVAAAAAGGAAGAGSGGNTAATAAAAPTAASSSSSLPVRQHHPSFQPQTPTPLPPPLHPSSTTAAATAVAAAADLALQQQQQQRQRETEKETAARSAQDLHRAIQRSQERLEYLLDEGCQVTEGLVKVGGGKEGRKGGKKGGRKERRVEEEVSTVEEEGEEERRLKRKKKKEEEKKKKEGGHHHHHRCRKEKQAETTKDEEVEEEEEEEEGEEEEGREEEEGDGRQELKALIQSTQEEVDAAVGERPGRVNKALADYLNTLKVSLRRLEGGGGRGRGEGGAEDVEEEGGDQ